MRRCEVGFVGSGIGAVGGDMFAVVMFMSIATTIVAPPALAWLYRGHEEATADLERGLAEP